MTYLLLPDKNTARLRSMVFEGAKLHSYCRVLSKSTLTQKPTSSVGGKWLYVVLPKIGIVKVRHHRPLPNGVILKQVQIVEKADGWYISCDSFLRNLAVFHTVRGIESVLKVTHKGGVKHLTA